MRPYQIVAFVVGLTWILVFAISYLYGELTGRPRPLIAEILVTLAPALLLWWPTGILKRIHKFLGQ